MRNAAHPNPRSSLLAVALTAGLASSAVAGVGGLRISVNFNPAVLGFENPPPVYILGMSIDGTGFVDDNNQDNYLRLEASDHSFSTDWYPARHAGSGTAGSSGHSSTADLTSAINGPASWTLTAVDGVTHVTSTYILDVTTMGITDDLLRPITLDVQQGDTISNQPTMTFTQAPATDPQNANTSGFAFFIGSLPGNFATTPALLAGDTSWTPDTTLIDDVYTFLVDKRNETPDQNLFSTTAVVPQGGAAPLASFTTTVTAEASAQTSGLIVGMPFSLVSVSMKFSPVVISFSPLDPPIYILGVELHASGFTDDDNLDNFIEVHSATNQFSSDLYPARQTGSGTAGSASTGSAADLSELINSESAWTMKITDGVTGAITEYTLNVTTPGIAADYLRPMTLDVNPGDVISANPTFGFTQDPTTVVDAQYTSAFAALIGNSHSYGDPPVTPEDRSWSPVGPVAPDTYTVLFIHINDQAPQTLIAASTPVPVGTARPLTGFTTSLDVQVDGQTGNLTLAPACPQDFNNDGDINPDDLGDFITCYFTEPPCLGADFNHDGDVNPDDLGDFITAYFGPAC